MKDSMQQQYGVGIIEILVTLFILSVGLLGVASLQLVGSFTNAEALSRTQAEFVAQQAIERLRAATVIDTTVDGAIIDADYFNANNYNFANLAGVACATPNEPFDCYCTALPAGIPNCESAECSGSEMATFDAWALSCSAVQTNPNTQITISCNDNTATDTLACSPGALIDVQLTWPLRGQNATGNNNGTEVQVDPRCTQEVGQAFSCVTKVAIF